MEITSSKSPKRALNVDRDVGTSRVTAVAASSRGDVALGTEDGWLHVLRVPTTSGLLRSLYPSGGGDAPLLALRHHPLASGVVDIAVVPTPAGGAVAATAHDSGVVAVTPVAPDPSSTSVQMSGVRLVDAAFDGHLIVAMAGENEVALWLPEDDRLMFAPVGSVVTSLRLLPPRDGPPAVALGVGGGFVVYEVEGESLTQRLEVATGDDVVGIAAWPWPDETVRLATASRRPANEVAIWPVDPVTWQHGVCRRFDVSGDVMAVTHIRDLLGVVLADGGVELLSLGASGRQHLEGEGAVVDAALMRSPDGRPALVSVGADGNPSVQDLDLQRRAGDDLLTLNNDSPVGHGPDLLGFGAYARPLSIVIAASTTATPLVIGVDGAWGQGKTRLGRMVDDELPRGSEVQATELDCHSIWFNAWMHSDATDMATAMAAAMAVGLQPLRPWWKRVVSPAPGGAISLLRRNARLIATVLVVIAGLAVLFQPDFLDRIYTATDTEAGTALFSLGGVSVTLGAVRLIGLARDRLGGALASFLRSTSDVVDAGRVTAVRADLGRRIADATRPIPDAAAPSRVPLLDRVRRWARDGVPGRFRNLVRGPLAGLFGVRHGQRVVLFVDDLDRCEAAQSIQACETISQLLDHQGLVTVVMVDLEALGAHAEVVFSDLAERINKDDKGAGWGRRFLDKIFQFEFTIPAHRPVALGALLKSSLDERAPLPVGEDPTAGATVDIDLGTTGLASLGPVAVAPTVPSVSGLLGSGPHGPLTGLDYGLLANFGRRRVEHRWVRWVRGPREAERRLGGTAPVVADVPDRRPHAVGHRPGGALVGQGRHRRSRPGCHRHRHLDLHAGRGTRCSTPKLDDKYFGDLGRLRSTADVPWRPPTSASAASSATGASESPGPADGPQGPPLTRRAAVRMVLEEGDHLDLGFREASRWLDGITPRTAKRLANRLLFTTAVATERGLLWTDSTLDGRVLGKWVTLIERWPRLAGAIRREPSVLGMLEFAAADPKVDDAAFAAFGHVVHAQRRRHGGAPQGARLRARPRPTRVRASSHLAEASSRGCPRTDDTRRSVHLTDEHPGATALVGCEHDVGGGDRGLGPALRCAGSGCR